MNNLQLISAIGQVVCLAVAFALPVLMAKDDAIEIELNGSFDSLKKNWHETSAETRAMIIGSLGFVSLLPAAMIGGQWLEALLFLLSYGLVAIALHWIIFDRKLNKLRGLDPDYVGENADSDKFLKRFTASEITRIKRQAAAMAAIAYLVSGYLLFITL